MSKASDAVLIHLIDNKAVRKGEYMWKWVEKGGPSLANPQVSLLFRAALVEEQGDELVLSTTGEIVVQRMIRGH